MPTSMTARFIRQEDFDEVVEMESLSTRYLDEDFDTHAHPPWALSPADFMEIISTSASRDLGTHDTRTLVIVAQRKGKKGPEPWVCGAFAYELSPECYRLLYAVVHPNAPLRDALGVVHHFLKTKAEQSEDRKRVVVHLVDRPEADVEAKLKFWKGNGFDVKLLPDHFSGADGWECSKSY